MKFSSNVSTSDIQSLLRTTIFYNCRDNKSIAIKCSEEHNSHLYQKIDTLVLKSMWANISFSDMLLWMEYLERERKYLWFLPLSTIGNNISVIYQHLKTAGGKAKTLKKIANMRHTWKYFLYNSEVYKYVIQKCNM